MKKKSLGFLNHMTFIITFILICSFHIRISAQQNSSYDANTLGIGGLNNVAFGPQSLLSNSGNYNSAVGHSALHSNTIGGSNTAHGYWALYSNTGGIENCGFGVGALFSNTVGTQNTGVGVYSLYSTTAGFNNSAVGYAALFSNVLGNNNTAIGNFADVGSPNLNNVTAIGAGAIVNASNSIQLGNSSVTTVFAGTGTNAKVITGGLQVVGGSPGVGKVLTSDAVGNATWQTPTGGGNSYFTAATVGTDNIINTNTGGVIIGTGITSAPAGYKLYVSDGILTEKVKVAIKNSGNWADYVFEEKYKLLEIAKLEEFIIKNKHLPGIQSANEIKENGGFELGQMTVKLLEKVEELTLYIIQLKKENEEIKAELKAVKGK